MNNQPNLFEHNYAASVFTPPETLEDKYKAWRETRHGIAVFDMFERLALMAAERNKPFGIALIAERVRWETFITGRDEDGYKVNNNHKAYIARELIAKHPELEALIMCRTAGG